MVHEPNEHSDGADQANVVRSQFGIPAGSGNNAVSRRRARHAAPDDDRGRSAKPRRRRYADGEDSSPNDDFPQWTVSRPSPHKRAAETAGTPKRRMTRAERRRAAAEEQAQQAQADEAADSQSAKSDLASASDLDFSATKSADLSRIADFLRSTQSATDYDDEPDPAPPSPPQNQVATSELPTVEVEPVTNATSRAPAQTQSPDDSILAAVRRVPGVTDARLTNSDSKLALDIADTADTEAVHRQVLEVLEANLGVQAQPTSSPQAPLEGESIDHPGAIPSLGRTVLERIQVFTSGYESTVEVGLEVNGMRAVGRATSPAVDWHILRGAADATVDAVGVLIGRHGRVVTEHAAIEDAGSIRVAVVVVLLLSEAGAEQLAGAAPVTGDQRQAVVHATLQALNRRLETILLA